MPKIDFPVDPVQTFPWDVQKSKNDHVIIHYLEKAIWILKDGTLVRWNFEKRINDGSIQFTFLPPLQGKKHLLMVITNRTSTTFRVFLSFTATSEPMPKEVEDIPGSMLRPIEIPACEPSETATTVTIHKRKHLFRALSSGRYLYFVARLQAHEEFNRDIGAMMPRQLDLIPMTEVSRRRSLSETAQILGVPPHSSWIINTSGSSSSSTMPSTLSSSTDSSTAPRRHSTTVPFDNPYTNIRQVPFNDMPLLTHAGTWSASAFEAEDASGHYWGLEFDIQGGNIEVKVSYQGDESDDFHSSIAIAFYVSDKYIPNEKSLHIGILVSRQQRNVHSSETPVFDMGTLKRLHDSATNIRKDPFVYFAYGIHSRTPKPTSNDPTDISDLQRAGTMSLNIRLKILAYSIEEEEYRKITRAIRSLSLSDPKRLGIDAFLSRRRSRLQSPVPSPLPSPIPSNSSSDDGNNEEGEDEHEDSVEKSGDQDEADERDEESLGNSTISSSTRAYQIWHGGESDETDKRA